ncbi:OmpA family protein [Fusibacter sp. JL216-2]|uniref:OmpA family protein n=1 Tax=Fusibacter sp. JL216-2 TaxID=3071453 RepID=UPI003D33E203
MAKYRRRRGTVEVEQENFWPAFTDIMSTIALILFFLILISYLSNIIVSKDLDLKKKELAEAKAEITSAQDRLDLLLDQVEETKAEVERGQQALKLSEDEIEKQKEIIANSNKELGDLRDKLHGIAVLRLDVLDKVKVSMEDSLEASNVNGKDLVRISDTGNIIINEGFVFDTDSYKVKEEGKVLLDKLALAFENVLSDDEVRGFIDAIAIQGHTDERGSSSYNRELSANRAAAVVNYLLSSNETLEEEYGAYFTASAYSEYRPVDPGTSEEAYAKNRRIEISMILRDAQIQDVINNYLEDSIGIFEE